MILHIDQGNDFPDVTNGVPCCMGYAANGHRSCTCWEPIYNGEQLPYDGASLPSEGSKCCYDCAYRKGSPERQGEKGYKGDEEYLNDLPQSSDTFFCHQGARKILKWRHENGTEIEAHPASYRPEIVTIDGESFPLRLDGSAQNVCAGFCAKRKAFFRDKSLDIREDI